MTTPYILYGSYASYYTAKTRSYLRKKSIPFIERLPSDPAFREKVRPASGSHRIPQLLTPNGLVIQDTVTIQDSLEIEFPDYPAIPSSPAQKTYVHLMELFASEGLLQLAWQHRWLFPSNHKFVIKDFGRSFRPQGSDQELEKYGNLIAERMMSYGLPKTTDAIQAELERQYLALLELYEQHLIEHPYLLGGHPSAADYAVMGALHAHMGRDPAGLQTMQNHAPRTLRWVENMLLPEIQSPEFYDRKIAFQKNDEVPKTAIAILQYIAQEYGQNLIASVIAYQKFVEINKPSKDQAVDSENDQPLLNPIDVNYRGQHITHQANIYHVWLAQRSQIYYSSLSENDQNRIDKRLNQPLLVDMLSTEIGQKLVRRNNRFYFGGKA